MGVDVLGNGIDDRFFISDFCREYSDDGVGYALYSGERYRFMEIDANGKVVHAEKISG